MLIRLFVILFMKVSELKKSLHEKIELVNDMELLNALHVIISKKEPVYKISSKYLESIKKAEKEIEESNFYTLKDFEEQYNKWLKN